METWTLNDAAKLLGRSIGMLRLYVRELDIQPVQTIRTENHYKGDDYLRLKQRCLNGKKRGPKKQHTLAILADVIWQHQIQVPHSDVGIDKNAFRDRVRARIEELLIEPDGYRHLDQDREPLPVYWWPKVVEIAATFGCTLREDAE